MKKIMKRILIVLLTIALVFTSVNFNNINVYAAPKKYVKTLKLSKSKITLNVGKRKTIKVHIKTKGKISKKFTVKSSNKKIVRVSVKKSKIVIKAKKAGSAKITVRTKGKNKRGKKIKKVVRVKVKKNSTVQVSKPSNDKSNVSDNDNNLGISPDFNNADLTKGYTRKEWIEILADMFEFKNNNTISKENYYFADTQDAEYGQIVEVANAFGILPECDAEGYEDGEQDLPLFEAEKLVSREYATYTIVKALGFEENENETVNSNDSALLKYDTIDAIGIYHGLIALENNRFKPSDFLNRVAGRSMLTRAQEIIDSAIVDESKHIDEVKYQDGVNNEINVEEDEADIYESGDNIYVITVPNNDKTSSLHKGDVFVLPSTGYNVSKTAYKIDDVQKTTDNEIVLQCYKPDLSEVVSEIKFEGKVEAENYIFEPADGVEVENDEAQQAYSLPSKSNRAIGGSVKVPGKLKLSVSKKISEDLKISGKVDISIPDITCKLNAKYDLWNREFKFNEFLVSIKEKIDISGELSCSLLESGYELNSDSGNTRWEKGNVEIGRAGIPLGTGLSVDIVFFWQVNAKGTASIGYTIEAMQGIQLVDGKPRVIHDFQQSINALDLKGSFKAGVGLALVVNAFDLMDLAGVDAAIGLGTNVSFELHPIEVLYCGDGAIYMYLDVSLSTETALGKFLEKVLHMTYSWSVFDEKNSPLKLNWHFENGKKVEACTYGTGNIEGIVLNSDRKVIGNARIKLYKSGILVRTLYSKTDGTFQIENLSSGDYQLKVSVTGYSTYDVSLVVQRGQTTYAEALIMIDRDDNAENGNVCGDIIDAVTGYTIKDVRYEVRKNWNNTSGEIISSGNVSDYYDITLNPGNYTINFIASGYVDTDINVAVYSNSENYKTVALSPELTQNDGLLRIVLTWSEQPWDLDSHLLGPTFSGEDMYHVYYADDYYYDYNYEDVMADLDIDDTDSYGPETITLHKINHEGMYHYYVHDFSNRDSWSSYALSESNAQVRVYKGTRLLQKFNVPTSAEGTLWHVFDYDAETERIIPVNQMSYEESASDVGR